MLKSLVIKNFRSLVDFSVPELGRVNLIVGKNNAGKSTVLEAIRIFAGNANSSLLDEIAESHDEALRSRNVDLNYEEGAKPYQDFFSGRIFPDTDGVKILIGDSQSPEEAVTIEHVLLQEYQETIRDDSGEPATVSRRRIIAKSDIIDDGQETIRQAIYVKKGERFAITPLDSPRVRNSVRDLTDVTRCGIVPTNIISMNDLARDWDKIALTGDEQKVKDTLRFIAPDLEGLAFVETGVLDRGIRREFTRTARVKIAGVARPVPLGGFGEGMVRLLQMSLRAFSARGGFLLIDEFENGLHYTVQDNVWETIFHLSDILNIQVFATTHSWDCIQSFSRVAEKHPSVGGVLFRVGKSVRKSEFGKVISTVFEGSRLSSVTQEEIEVR